MGGSKMNSAGRLLSVHRKHHCPECGEPAKLFRRMPGKSMWGRCENGHAHHKNGLILK